MLGFGRETTVYITVDNEKDREKLQNMYSFVDNQCVLSIEDVEQLMQEGMLSIDDYREIDSIVDLSDIILTLD